MRTTVIIPARMNSSRFPGKPLENILGMPMIGHCYKRACLAKNINNIYVATCDHEIKQYIQSIGGNVIMTSSSHIRASTRTEEAISKLKESHNLNFDKIIMLQGDEPLIRPESISSLIKSFDSQKCSILNLISPIKNNEQFIDKNNVKVVFNKEGKALYFSREPIPSAWLKQKQHKKYMQVGVIAFSDLALRNFNKLKESSLEICESIDMNRVLENGGDIYLSPINYEMIGVDCENDLNKAEELMKLDPIYPIYNRVK